MKTILFYLKPHRFRIAYGLFMKGMGTFMDLGLPWVLAYIIDDIIPFQQVSLILWWGLVMLGLSVAARSFNVIANRMAAKVARNSVEVLRHDLFVKIQSLSGTQVDYFTIPSLESRMTSDTYNIHNMIGMMQRIGIRAPIILIGGVIITSTLEPVLTLVLIGTLPFLGMSVYLVSKKGIPLYTGLQVTIDRMIRVVRENISGVRVIKALSKGDFEKRRFTEINHEVSYKELQAETVMAITNPIMNMILNLGLTFVIVAGAYRVNAGASEPGKIVAFLSYFTIMLHAVMAITRIFVISSKALASSKRITQVLDAPPDLSVIEARLYPTAYHIEFHHVSFSYTQEPYVTEIDFHIKKGESLGIIGSTGAGKTTLVNLLMRFYDVDAGRITIDGRDVRNFDEKELRRKFGVVFQNDILFADQVSENIKLGRALSREDIIRALEHAQALSFVEQLNDKSNDILAMRGSNLSGGQKQRLLVARALAGHPEILILDDSSSALDYKTDAMLRKEIREHYKDTTTIIIAQRISSVMKLDHILVMEEGRMAGFGTHEDLLKSCEIYQEIYQSQFKS